MNEPRRVRFENPEDPTGWTEADIVQYIEANGVVCVLVCGTSRQDGRHYLAAISIYDVEVIG